MAKAKSKTQEAKAAAYGNAAHLLIAALEGAPGLHPRPFHRGGSQPKIDAAGYVIAVLWVAERARPFVDAADLLEFDRIVGLATEQVKRGRDDLSLVRALLEASRPRWTKIPMRIATWTCHEAHNWIARPIYAGGAARPAARQLVALTLKKHGSDAAAALLAEIDALCVHLEALYMLANHELVPAASPVATRWRGFTAGKATSWILELADGQLALISKIGSRWKLTEGDRAFVLAHVADHQLDGAAAAT